MIDQNSEEDKNSAINECSLMQHIDSPFVLNCEEVYLYNNEVFMFIQYMRGGELTKILKAAKRIGH